MTAKYISFCLFFKGHKQLVLEGVTCFFNNLDETCRKEDKEDRWVILQEVYVTERICVLQGTGVKLFLLNVHK